MMKFIYYIFYYYFCFLGNLEYSRGKSFDRASVYRGNSNICNCTGQQLDKLLTIMRLLCTPPFSFHLYIYTLEYYMLKILDEFNATKTGGFYHTLMFITEIII